MRISKRTIQFVLLGILGLLLIYYFLVSTKPLERVTLEGYITCIPKKETNTLGCEKGIVNAKGEYYESDTLLMSTFSPQFEIGSQISARGVMRKYSWYQRLINPSKATGSFSITDSLRIE